MPDLWMPGAIRIESTRRNPLNNNGYRLITWPEDQTVTATFTVGGSSVSGSYVVTP